ncbi:hypothetical protein AX14_003313 [Amanita brunnescens Koide BX004]|nr:hypothetical protein AX14_003313 [Amanita brunnescens Koide BX004]
MMCSSPSLQLIVSSKAVSKCLHFVSLPQTSLLQLWSTQYKYIEMPRGKKPTSKDGYIPRTDRLKVSLWPQALTRAIKQNPSHVMKRYTTTLDQVETSSYST